MSQGKNQPPPPDAKPPVTLQDHRVRQVELLISNLLRIGVSVSLVIVAVGTIITFIRHRQYMSDPAALKDLITFPAKFPASISDVFSYARHALGRGLVMVGLLLLIATPVMRVAVSIFAFIYERDRAFMIITSIVLLLLLLSFLVGKAGG